MKKFVLVVLAVVAIVGCPSSDTLVQPPADQTVLRPGEGTSFLEMAQYALKCPDGVITWTIVQPNGGTIDGNGNYHAPKCTDPGYSQGTYTIVASGCGNQVNIPVTITEDVIAVTIPCGVIGSATCCTPGPNFQIGPGETIQFYSRIEYTCSDVYSPAQPPAMCQ